MVGGGWLNAQRAGGSHLRVAVPVVAVLATVSVFLGGCVGFTPAGEHPVSHGMTNHGVLLNGVAMPDRGPGYVRARAGESTRFGTPELVGTLERAAASVAHRFPGGAPLRVGDLSGPGGGRHHRHGSHRTGRDADLLFYATDTHGRAVGSTGFVRFDRFGFARIPPGAPRGGQTVVFDDARNWALVRALLMDEQAPVQWIFCSNGIKARLLRHAALHEPSAEAVFRATWALHEPTGALPHDDHFHVRVACTAAQRASGCLERGPIWPWIRKAVEKPATRPHDPLTDARLIRALLAPMEPEDRRTPVARLRVP
jgi:penicillin-insensitive murein DD-endopeptidase